MKTYTNFLNEKKESKEKKYTYGVVMLYFEFEELKDIHKLIDEDDISEEDGLEIDSHLTLLYGFHSDEIKNEQKIFDTILDYNIDGLLLYNVSLFENDDFDVLKFDVKENMKKYIKKDDILFKINKELSDNFKNTSDFNKYKPHSTIAYLKSGSGKKYVKKLKDKEYVVKPIKLVYSKPNKDGSDKITKEHKI